MIDAKAWMADLLPQLRQAFGARLQYLGLQGSYRRGEATEASDIDVVLLLDAVALDDLDVYRAIVRGMPEGQKACGFIGSVADMLHWPRHEQLPQHQQNAQGVGQSGLAGAFRNS